MPEDGRLGQGRDARDGQGVSPQRERTESREVRGLGQGFRPLVRDLVVRQAQPPQPGQRRGSRHGLGSRAAPPIREQLQRLQVRQVRRSGQRPDAAAAEPAAAHRQARQPVQHRRPRHDLCPLVTEPDAAQRQRRQRGKRGRPEEPAQVGRAQAVVAFQPQLGQLGQQGGAVQGLQAALLQANAAEVEDGQPRQPGRGGQRRQAGPPNLVGI